MRLLLAALWLALLPVRASARDVLMEKINRPDELALLLREHRPKGAHLDEALADAWRFETFRDSAKLLLRAGLKAPWSSRERYRLLEQALRTDDAELVSLLLASGVPADVTDGRDRETALHMAAGGWEWRGTRHGSRPVLEALLDAGADPDLRRGGFTPLQRAARACRAEAVDVLLSRGARLAPGERFDASVCPSAAQRLLASGAAFAVDDSVAGDTETIRLVLESSPTIRIGGRSALDRALFEFEQPNLPLADLFASRGSTYTSCDSGSALERAARAPARLPALRWLLEHLSERTLCSAKGSLEAAWDARNREAVKLLLSRGEDVRALDGGGKPLLFRAVCDPELLRLALENGADARQRFEKGDGRTPLIELMESQVQHRKCDPSGIAILVAEGGEVDAVDSTGGTALTRLLGSNYNDDPPGSFLTALLRHKPDVNHPRGAPLRYAMRWPEALAELLAAGADPKRSGGEGWTLFSAAVSGKNIPLKSAELLLEAGAKLDAPDALGRTALLGAAKAGRADAVSWLLSKGADRLWQDNERKTAYDLAADAETRNLLRPQPRAEAPGAAPDVDRIVKQAVAAAVAERRPEPAAAPAPPAAPSSDVDKPGYSSPEDPDAYAVVVGVEEYSDLPKASFAERDAAAVRRHLKALGVPERNLVLLAGQKAGRAALAKYLETWLPKNVNERSKVYFFFSGHGAPDPTSGRAFLMPWDGDPSFLADTAYPVERLYKSLDGLKARHVVVALDACFSGAGGRSVLPEGARPLVARLQTPATGRIVVLSATQPDQITGVLKEQGHGLFTYHFLKGLAGAAAGPSGAVTPASLHAYLKPRVQDEARRQNREQTPSLTGPDGVVLRVR